MSTISEDLEQIKYDEDNIASNKVARFCYTEQAYQNDDYEGVPEFDPSVEQNIPLANADTLRTNATILDRGLRSQASALPRMLVNHFFGRVSYNLNKAHDNFIALIETIKNFIGQPNGIASLDENGRIPYSQLPESALNLRGDWDASTNTPALSDGMEGATLGDMYYVNVGGTVDFGHGEITFLPNDRVMYNQYNQWVQLSAGNVRKVNNKEPNKAEGNVTIYGEDIQMSETDVTSISVKMRQYIGSMLLGRSWAQSNIHSNNFSALYYANNIWVAGSRSGEGLYWSEDGKTWTQSNKMDGSYAYLFYANGVWVAGSSPNAGLYWSEDGKTWTQSNITDKGFYSVHYANGVWVAGSSSNAGLYWSEDGKTWTQSNKTNKGFISVYYANNIWVALSFTPSDNTGDGMYWSEDGKTWTQSNIRSNDFSALYYANNIWVAGSRSGEGLYWSEDGKTWTQSNIRSNDFTAVYYANGAWVAGSFSNVGLYWSEDGKTWTQSNIRSNDFTAVYYANGVWITVSSSNAGLYWSEDGKTWTQSNIRSNDFTAVYYANGAWVAGSRTKGLWYSSVQDLIDNGWVK